MRSQDMAQKMLSTTNSVSTSGRSRQWLRRTRNTEEVRGIRNILKSTARVRATRSVVNKDTLGVTKNIQKLSKNTQDMINIKNTKSTVITCGVTRASGAVINLSLCARNRPTRKKIMLIPNLLMAQPALRKIGATLSNPSLTMSVTNASTIIKNNTKAATITATTEL